MNQLLKAELKRRLSSFIFFCEIALIIGINFIQIIWSEFGFQVDTGYFVFQNFKIICILIAINSCLQIGQEFENHTINNKLYVGFSKSEFYKYEMVVGIIETVILFLFDTLSVIIMSSIQKFTPITLSSKIILNSLAVIIALTVVSCLSTTLAVIIKYRIVSVFIIIGLSILLLNVGYSSARSLMQPPKTTLFSLDGKLCENPLYVTGSTRTLHNLHINISPYGQATYACYLSTETQKEKYNNSLFFKKNSWHIEFVLIDILELIIIYAVGLYILKRRDLN
ncbi:MAG: hypothetical protein U0K86_06825 [Agathobacter sp.]|nr:hypothetical protein [Agathobacter sp.]